DAGEHAEWEHPPLAAPEHAEEEEHDRREHDGTDHQRPQELVLLGLDLERLPHLAALLLARLPLGGPCRLLVRLAALALRHAPQDTWHLWRARTAATAPGGSGPPTPRGQAGADPSGGVRPDCAPGLATPPVRRSPPRSGAGDWTARPAPGGRGPARRACPRGTRSGPTARP